MVVFFSSQISCMWMRSPNKPPSSNATRKVLCSFLPTTETNPRTTGCSMPNGVANTSPQIPAVDLRHLVLPWFLRVGIHRMLQTVQQFGVATGARLTFVRRPPSSSYNGVAFNVNGHRPQANRLMSVGLR